MGVPNSGVLEYFEFRVFYDEIEMLTDVVGQNAAAGERFSLEVNGSNEVYLGRDADGNILIASKNNIDDAAVVIRGIIYGRGIIGPQGEAGPRGADGAVGPQGEAGRDGRDSVALLIENPCIWTIGSSGTDLGFIRTITGFLTPDIPEIHSILITQPSAGRVAFQVAVSDAAGRTWLDGQTYICLLYTSPSPRDS